MSTTILYKVKRFYGFLSLLTVEPYLFVAMFVLMLKKVPLEQLVQDKLCRNTYNINATYCSHLSTMTDDEDYLGIKSKILTETTTFSLSGILILTLPSVVAALFIGQWTDTYIKAKKVLLIAGALAGVVEAVILVLNDYFFELSHYVLLLSMVPSVFAGGLLAMLSANWSYVASTTPPHMRAPRMACVEIINSLAQPFGTYIGGVVLNTQSPLNGGQLHNSSGVFAIGGIAFLLALIWSIFMIDEERDIREWEQRFGVGSDSDNLDNECENRIQKRLKRFSDNKHIHPMKLLLNTNNAKEMWRTCSKKRDNQLRLQIWLLFLSLGIYMLSHVGPVIFMFQFSQKMYNWDSETYSNASAIGSVVLAMATITCAPILLKVLKLKDTILVMIGLISYFMQNVVRGVVLTPVGFFTSLLPGCLGSVGSIGMRSHFSKIVKPQELGKIFSFMGALEAITPLIAAGIMSPIFNATIDTMPGLSLLITAVILVIPFGVAVWIHYYTVLPDFSHNSILDAKDVDSEGKSSQTGAKDVENNVTNI